MSEEKIINEETVETVEATVEEVVAPVVETVVVEETAAEEVVDLESLKVADLRELAKNKGIAGYSTMKKAELIEALK